MLSCLLIADREARRLDARTPCVNDDSVEEFGTPQPSLAATYIFPCRAEPLVENKYDLFERFPNGSSIWRGSVSGFDRICLRLNEVSQKSANQFYAITLTSGEGSVFNSELDVLGTPRATPLKEERRSKGQAA
jgi:hypothetical protein